MVKLVTAIVTWGLCVLGAILTPWFPKLGVLCLIGPIPFSMMVLGRRKQLRGEIDLQKAPELFKWLSVLGQIAGIPLIVRGFWMVLVGNDDAFNAVWIFFGYGIFGGSKAMELWAADYWWYGPSIINYRVREFFKLRK